MLPRRLDPVGRRYRKVHSLGCPGASVLFFWFLVFSSCALPACGSGHTDTRAGRTRSLRPARRDGNRPKARRKNKGTGVLRRLHAVPLLRVCGYRHNVDVSARRSATEDGVGGLWGLGRCTNAHSTRLPLSVCRREPRRGRGRCAVVRAVLCLASASRACEFFHVRVPMVLRPRPLQGNVARVPPNHKPAISVATAPAEGAQGRTSPPVSE